MNKLMTKESIIYLTFFKQNLVLILFLGILGGAGGFYYQDKQPIKLENQNNLEMDYDKTNLNQRINLTDEAVSILRSQVLEQKLQLNPQDEITIFKSGPVLIEIDVTGSNSEMVSSDQTAVDFYLLSNFPSHQLGKPVIKNLPRSFFQFGIGGLVLGGFLGLLIGLIKFYFTNY